MHRRFAILLAFVSFGCHGAYSNENLLYLKAIPRDLQVDVPEKEGAGQGLRAAQFEDGQARFYGETLQETKKINDQLEEIFGHLDNVVKNTEPAGEEDNTRVWGPLPADGAELALFITHVTTTTTATVVLDGTVIVSDDWYEYALLARPVGGTDLDWVPALFGRSIPDESTPFGTGALFLDLKVLDPGGQGIIFIAYDSRFDSMALDFIVDVNFDPMTEKFDPEAGWRFRRAANGDIDYRLFYYQDTEDEGPRPELFQISARWRADWFGRADVLISGGDLGLQTFDANECWDPGFLRTYFDSNFPLFFPQRTGTPQDCAEGLREAVYFFTNGG